MRLGIRYLALTFLAATLFALPEAADAAPLDDLDLNLLVARSTGVGSAPAELPRETGVATTLAKNVRDERVLIPCSSGNDSGIVRPSAGGADAADDRVIDHYKEVRVMVPVYRKQ